MKSTYAILNFTQWRTSDTVIEMDRQRILSDYTKEETAELKTRGLSGIPWEDIAILKQKHFPGMNLEFVNPMQNLTNYIKAANSDNLDGIGTRYLHIIEGTDKFFKKDITYREKFRKMDNVSRSFIDMNLKRGDVVTLVSVGTPEVEQIIYGLNTIGVRVLSLDPRDTPDNLGREIARTDSKAVVILDRIFPKFAKEIQRSGVKQIIALSIETSFPLHIKTLLSLKHLRRGGEANKHRELQQLLIDNNVIPFERFITFGKRRTDNLDIPFIENETAILVTTGGSTGAPKMVELTNENFNCLMEQYKIIIGCEKGEVYANELPPWVAFGLATAIHSPNSLSLTLMINPVYDFTKFPKRYLITKPKHIAVTPLHLSLLMDEIVSREKLRALKVIEQAEELEKEIKQQLIGIVKAAKVSDFFKTVKGLSERSCLSHRTKDALSNIFEDLSNNRTFIIGGNKVTYTFRKDSGRFFVNRGGVDITQGFGTTESNSTLATDIPHCINHQSVGVVMPYNDVEVRDPKTNEILGFNRKGLIAFSGPSHGHYTDPENTKKTNYISRGKTFIRTGDTGWLNMDGTVGYEGRHSRMIIIDGGFNINPERTEEVLAKIPYIKESMVIGATIENMQQTIAVAHVVLNSDKELSDHDREEIIKDIYQQLDGKIPEHYMPAIIKIDKQLMRTNRGKPDFISTARADEEELNRSGFKMEKGKGYGKSIQVT